jgi:hypothetical protein
VILHPGREGSTVRYFAVELPPIALEDGNISPSKRKPDLLKL